MQTSRRRTVARCHAILLGLLLLMGGCGGSGGGGDETSPKTAALEVVAYLSDPVTSGGASVMSAGGSSPFRAKGSATEVTAVRLTAWDCGTGGVCDETHTTGLVLDESLTLEPISGAYKRTFDTTFTVGHVYEFQARGYKLTDPVAQPDVTTWLGDNVIFNTSSVGGIYKTHQVAASGNTLVINLVVEDDGLPYLFPRVLAIAIDPSLVLPGSGGTTIAFTVGSAGGGPVQNVPEDFTWEVAGTSGEGVFRAYDDQGGLCTADPIPGNTGTVSIPVGQTQAVQTVCFQAPSAEGFFRKTIRVTNASGDSVTVGFYLYVSLDAVSSGLQVYTPPVVLNVGAEPLLSNDVRFSAEVVDDKPLSGLDYNWIFTPSTNGEYSYAGFSLLAGGTTTAGENPSTLYHYTPDVAGTLTLTVSDQDSGVSNAVSVSLGPGQFPEALLPLGVFQALQVGGGKNHSCSVLASGNVACWGLNSSGQLGDGTTTNRTVPRRVKNASGAYLTQATRIALGQSHTCALTSSGIECWGQDAYGQLGNDAPTTGSSTPVSAAIGGAASAVVAGDWHTCALLADSSVNCWGRNQYGQLGDNTLTNRPTPTLVLGDRGTGSIALDGVAASVVAVAAGAKSSCAVMSGADAGQVWCWGANDQGQLGRDLTSAQLARDPIAKPVLTAPGTPLSGAVDVVVGGDHACALLGDTSVVCWGYNAYGQVGNGTAATPQLLAVPVLVELPSTPLAGVSELTAGTYHTCARLSDGTLRCWGYNANGRLGNSAVGISPSNSALPVAPHPATDIYVKLAAGDDHTCAVRPSGHVRCWGYNNLGQLGDGTTEDRLRPVGVDALGLFQ